MFKVRAFILKKWNSESWNGDIWENSDGDGVKFWNSDDCFLPVKAGFQLLSEGISLIWELKQNKRQRKPLDNEKWIIKYM